MGDLSVAHRDIFDALAQVIDQVLALVVELPDLLIDLLKDLLFKLDLTLSLGVWLRGIRLRWLLICRRRFVERHSQRRGSRVND